MDIRKYLKDQVSLLKKDGRRFDDIKAFVQSEKIVTADPKIPIEDGDRFERKLPSDIVETYVVLDAGFIQGLARFLSHYESKVRKETAFPPSTPPTHTVYNLIGPNARVNIQSMDSSTNVVNVETSALFEALHKTLEESIVDEGVRQILREKIVAMQGAAGTSGFLTKYKEFIEVAANHLTLFTQFLPALTQLLFPS